MSVFNLGAVTIGPAGAPGNLVIDDDYEQFPPFGTSSGGVTMELYGSGGQHDVLTVNGTATLSGNRARFLFEGGELLGGTG